MRILFVGGITDGQTSDFGEAYPPPLYRMPIIREPQFAADVVARMTDTYELYRLIGIFGVLFYVKDGMTTHALLTKLSDEYVPSQKNISPRKGKVSGEYY